MIKIIAVINQKGGVGKTATACHLAYCLAKKNKSTLLVDIDPSANATSFFLPDVPVRTVKDFLLSKEVDPTIILPAFQNQEPVINLSLLPSHISLALTEVYLSGRSFRETLLAKKLLDHKIANYFEYIIIDCPPTLSTLTVNAMYAANFILIPVTYQRHALDGIADLFAVLHEIKEGQAYDYRIVRNQHDGRKRHVNEYLANQIEHLGSIVLESIIHQDEAVNRATIKGLTVFEGCPHTSAAPDYQQLCNELEGILNV